MTAVVGILNKQGIAIAADSAVTVSGKNRKVYNYANKVFMLSHNQPVGVAIYNNAHLNGIPWEILIKEYRKHLHDKIFSTLAEYRKDFFDWLSSHNYFLENRGEQHILSDLLVFVQTIIHKLNSTNANKNELKAHFLTYLKDYVDIEIPKHKTLDSLCGLDQRKTKEFIRLLVEKAKTVIKRDLDIDFANSDFNELLTNAYFEFLTHDQFAQFSGIIFFGYGHNDLFPRLLPVYVSVVIDNKIRMADDKAKEVMISDNLNACIQPFAQTDVVDTILQGMSPELKNVSTQTFLKFVQGFISDIKSMESMPEGLKQQINHLNLDKIKLKYSGFIENIIKEKYVTPLMSTVAQLSKEDLAEMAESLVHLTYLKRRFTMAEESVGGPVDVAIITKGDGFIWIKRKHYFDPELNQHYFRQFS
jgi:hypothetical protein